VDAYVEWQRQLGASVDPVGGQERLDAQNLTAEDVYLGLRTSNGLRLTGAELVHVEPWTEAGWGRVEDENRLVLTPLGWLRLDSLAADLTVVRSRS
jgi:oxygen-independent coproporphyrinogen-3 oxidase